MNEVIENMKTRRSIRKFKSDMVPREVMDQIIEAGLYAPTGMGKQSTIIVAVTNKELRDRLSKANQEIAGMPEGMDPFYGAPVVLIVLANKAIPTYLYDGPITMANLMNAAHSLDVDSIWIHRAKQEFEMPEFQAVLKELGVEGEYEGIGHCLLGYRDCEYPEAAPRNEGRVFYAE